jgi:hypothetical protein
VCWLLERSLPQPVANRPECALHFFLVACKVHTHAFECVPLDFGLSLRLHQLFALFTFSRLSPRWTLDSNLQEAVRTAQFASAEASSPWTYLPWHFDAIRSDAESRNDSNSELCRPILTEHRHRSFDYRPPSDRVPSIGALLRQHNPFTLLASSW